MNYIRDLIVSLFCGFLWSLGASLFGLLPIWLKLIDVSLKTPDSTIFFEFVRDGSILFFASAITGGVLLDIIFDQDKTERGSYVKLFIYSIVPIVIIILASQSYNTILSIKDWSLARENFVFFNKKILLYSLAFSLFGKTLVFMNNAGKTNLLTELLKGRKHV